jgi:hypothetical protein
VRTLKPEKWDPRPFVHLSKLPASPASRRAGQAARILLDKSGKKLLREWETFTRFCRAAGLAIEPADVVMLDPNSSNPSPPDLKCSIEDVAHFFELGEVIQQDIAWALSRPIFEAHLPLAQIWDSLEIMLAKKLKKNYDPEARPVSLLLYYASGPSFWEFLRPIVAEKSAEVQTTLESSVFDSVFVFDAINDEILFRFSRSFAPVIAQPFAFGIRSINHETPAPFRPRNQNARNRQPRELDANSDSIIASWADYAHARCSGRLQSQ